MAKKEEKKAEEVKAEAVEKAAEVKEKAEKEEKTAPKPAAKKEVAKSNEQILGELLQECKDGEEPCVSIKGADFLIKEVRGLEIVLTRKDYR